MHLRVTFKETKIEIYDWDFRKQNFFIFFFCWDSGLKVNVVNQECNSFQSCHLKSN